MAVTTADPAEPDQSTKLEVFLQQMLWPISVLFYGATFQLFFFRRCRAASVNTARCILLLESVLFSVFYQLMVTVLGRFLVEVAVLMMVISVISLAIYYTRCHDSAAVRSESCARPRTNFIAWARGSLFLATAICILAVDFPTFPHRFAKCEAYGVSLMDVGVGWYIVVNAMSRSYALTDRELRSSEIDSSPTKKSRLPKWVWQHVPLFALGVVRLVSVKLLKYHVSIPEYGVHWNFFFTLFAVRVWSTIVRQFASRAYDYVLAISAIVLLGLTEYLLQSPQIKNFLLNGDRDTLISANREGLVSLMGYCALLNIAVLITRFAIVPLWSAEGKDNKQIKLKSLAKLAMAAMLCFLGLVVLETVVGPPYRRFANSTYVLWIMFASIILVALMALIELVMESLGLRFAWPLLFDLLGSNGLVHFLIANILTGVTNLTLNPRGVKNVYLSITFQAVYIVTANLLTALFARLTNYKLLSQLPFTA